MRNLIRSEYFSISALLIIAFAIGIMTFRDYGESFDEGEIYWYGEYSTNSYLKILKGNIVQDFELPNLNHYGPSYFMMVSLLSSAEQQIVPTLTITQTWHLFYFVTFLFGSFAIYILARRWMSIPAAFGTAILYTTQPLLWGHAFINPKDIPFLTFFLASIVVGLWMCDKIFLPDTPPRWMLSFWSLAKRLVQTWNNFLSGKKAYNTVILWAFSILLLWLFGSIFDYVIALFINSMYSATPQSFWGFWFARLAPHANNIPASSYISKAETLFHNAKVIFTGMGALIIAWSIYLKFPYRLKYPGNFPLLVNRIFSLFSKWPVLAAGIILGLTTSIRILGPLAGVIVTIYALGKYGKKAIAPLIVYAITAISIMFLTWPYLWNAPLTRFYETLTMMSSFPWAGPVFFNGNYYSARDLPWSYLPVLLSIQLTEPVILLFLTGCVIMGLNLRHHSMMDFFIIVLLWFFIPFIGLIITRRPLYDNSRQMLFLFPPVFLLCGVALEFILQRLNRVAWKVILFLVVISPGLYGVFSLHPYQYVYYNSLVGGTGGAFHRFEMDYWLISYKEAVDYLNASAPIGATIIVPVGYHLIHTRPDLIVQQSIDPASPKHDYGVLSAPDRAFDYFPEDQIVLSIERNGAILTVVKQSQKYHSP